MSRSAICPACGDGALEYVPDALSFVCVSCGIMSDPNQYFLVGDDNDGGSNVTGYEREGMRAIHHEAYARRTINDQADVSEESSLLREQRYRRNMVCLPDFLDYLFEVIFLI